MSLTCSLSADGARLPQFWGRGTTGITVSYVCLTCPVADAGCCERRCSLHNNSITCLGLHVEVRTSAFTETPSPLSAFGLTLPPPQCGRPLGMTRLCTVTYKRSWRRHTLNA